MIKILFFLASISILNAFANESCKDFSQKIDNHNAKLYSKCSKACETDEDCSSIKHGCDTFSINKLYLETFLVFMDQFQSRTCQKGYETFHCSTTKCTNNYCTLNYKKCEETQKQQFEPAPEQNQVEFTTENQTERMHSYRLLTQFGDPGMFKKGCPNSQGRADEIFLATEKKNYSSVEKLLDQIKNDSTIEEVCKIYLLQNINPQGTFLISNVQESEKLQVKANSILALKIIEVVKKRENKSISHLLSVMDVRSWTPREKPTTNMKLDQNLGADKESKHIIFSIKLSLARTGRIILTAEDYDYYLFEYLPDHAENPVLPLDNHLLSDNELKNYINQNKDKLFTPMMLGKLNYFSKRPMNFQDLISADIFRKNIKAIIENEKIDHSLKCQLLTFNEEIFSNIGSKQAIKDIAEADISKTPCLAHLQSMARNVKFANVGKCEVSYIPFVPIIGKPPLRRNNEGYIQLMQNSCLASCISDSDCDNLERTSCRVVPGNKKFAKQFQSVMPELANCSHPEKNQYKFSCVSNQCILNQDCTDDDVKKDAEALLSQIKDSSCEMDYHCKRMEFSRKNQLPPKTLTIGFKPSDASTEQLRKFNTFMMRKCGIHQTYSGNPQGKCIERSCHKIQINEGNSETQHRILNP